MNENETVNILVVDDLLVNLVAIEAIIERENYRLIKATSGEEALKLILKYDFAVILLDVQMPGLDGFETAKIIKAREKTKDIPIIFITANNMDSEHIFVGYSVGAVDYILKPFDPFILKSKVDVFVQLYSMKQKLIQQADALAASNIELKRAYVELNKSEILAKVISDTSIDSMVVLDTEGKIIRVNPAVASMFQYTEQELIGRKLGYLFHTNDQTQVDLILKKVISARTDSTTEQLTDVMAKRKDSLLFPTEIQLGMRYIQEQDQYILACIIHDVTKAKQDHETITKMAYYDWLTNLPNRRYFNDRIKEECANAKKNQNSFSLLYLDLDRFKYVNDSLGHVIGDQLLIGIAERLQSCLREEDFLARIGGDEFNLLLPNTGRETALEFAENILEEFAKPFHLDNFELFITTSIGIGVFPYDGEDSQSIVKNTDAALYRAKEQGKNQYRIYHSGMNMKSYRSFILQNDLHKAVERDELALVYQPRIDLNTGKVISAEALVNWNHPHWGTVLSSEFLLLAEEAREISQIGEWVLREICRQHNEWEMSGATPMRIAVNFSTTRFFEKNIVDNIKQIYDEHEVPLTLLEIEIKQSTISSDEENISKIIGDLRKYGVFVTIDEFGTGNCPVDYYWKNPVDSLRIARSLIQNIPNFPENTTIIQSMLDFADKLKVSVIAEGIETEEQLNILRELCCKELQGDFICPPISPPEFESFLSNYKANPIQKNDVEVAPLQFSLPQSPSIQNQQVLQTSLHQIKEEYSISRREFEVFELMVEGHNNKEISQKLFISEHTVKNHITHIFQKLNVTDRIQAMSKVYQACIIEKNH